MIFSCGKPDAFSESSVFTENHGAIKMKHPVLLYYNYLFFNHRFVWKEEPSPRLRSSPCSKSDSSKCTEHSTDVFDGCQFVRCLLANRTHFWQVTSSRGNKCIDMPSVLELLVQLTFLGPPVTQYLPKDFILGFSRLSPLSMLTKGLLGVLRCIQPVTSQDCFGRAKMAANFGLD